MNESLVERFSAEKFSLYWPLIRRELETVPHIWRDFWTIDSIFEMTIHEMFQCWGVGTPGEIDIVCWTQVAHYPAGNVLQVFLMIGTKVDRYTPHLDAVFEKFAHETNCKLIEVTGRQGWAGKLKGIGFRPGTTSVVRAVESWRMQ